MVVTIFRERLRNDADKDAYATLSSRMHELVAKHAGFISIKSYTADDGEAVSIETFDDMASLRAWRENPEHVAAQRRGRNEFYAEYSYETCQVERSGSWRLGSAG